MCQHAEGDSVQVRRMRPVRLHRAVCFQCRERGHLRRDCTASAREPASAHGGEEGHPWLQNEAADFTSDAANYEPTADVAVWDMDRASWPACCEEEGGAGFEYESPADPSSTEDDEEGGSAINEGAAGMPASCRFYAQIGRVCGHCPNCPFAVLMPDSDEDDDSSQRRRAVIQVRARLATSRPLLSLPATPPTPSRSARKGPPRHARYKGAYVQ